MWLLARSGLCPPSSETPNSDFVLRAIAEAKTDSTNSRLFIDGLPLELVCTAFLLAPQTILRKGEAEGRDDDGECGCGKFDGYEPGEAFEHGGFSVWVSERGKISDRHSDETWRENRDGRDGRKLAKKLIDRADTDIFPALGCAANHISI